MIEGAFLAGLVRSPSGYDPINNPEPSRRRFQQVTERLAAVELVHRGRARRASAETWPIPDRVRTVAVVQHRAHLLHRSRCATTCSPSRTSSAPPSRSGPTCCTAVACRSTPRSTPRCRPTPRQARNILPRQRHGLRRRRRVARHRQRRHPGDGRRARAAPRRTRRRGEHGARAAPDRIEHQGVHPRRGATRPAPRPRTSSTAPARARCPTSSTASPSHEDRQSTRPARSAR